MEKFEINILGCGSALPTTKHLPTTQVVNFRDKLFLIDCGEGVQLQFRYMKLKFSRINRIFLSHLHGDHCFGLIGLISTLGMLGRKGDLFIHAHPDAEKVFQPLLDFFCQELPYKVIFVPIKSGEGEVIYEDKSLKVSTLPLRHRVASYGFLFEEKPSYAHIKSDMIKYWKIPIKDLQGIKEGNDWTAPDGTVIANKVLTYPPAAPRKYAYCSDTAYNEKLIPYIKNVDLLYHEATFADDAKPRAKETMHSTAKQAATIALKAEVKQLMIGHFSARYDNDNILLAEALTVFENTIKANEGLIYTI